MEGMPVSGIKLPEIGDEIAGKYRIESVLGQGGMGTVFSAQNLLTGKRVAIKWLLPEHAQGPSRERLLREARIACSVEHPNIVDIYDVGEHQGGLFLVMEYLRGRALSDLLAERGRMDPVELIGFIIPAMRGVHAAHQAGVIHRDLKPENIILSEVDGHIIPKVVDFGVSKTVGASAVPQSSLTRTGALVGTPHYMALEQVDGSNLIDPRTDVYAFGVILYRALTGHFPFDGSSLGEVILKIGTKDPTPLRSVRPDLPPELDAVVLRSMSRARDRRFANLEELARALEPFAPWVRFREPMDPAARMLAMTPSSGELRMATPNGLTPQQLQAGMGTGKPTPQGMLGGASISAQVIGPRDTPASHHMARVKRTRAFWLGAGISLVLLLAACAWIMQKLSSEPVARPVPQLPVVPADKPAAKPAVSRAPETVPTLVPELKNEPALAPPPASAVPGPVALPVAPEAAPVEAEPAKALVAPAKGTRHHLPRAHTPGHASPVAPTLIPGDRTKGLSSDEF
jgi:serine/threonine protein kinase